MLAGLLVGLSVSGRAHAAEVGPFRIGGALRGNLIEESWATKNQDFPLENLEFDTAFPDIGFEMGRVSADVQYRYYYYSESDRSTHFLHHAWLSYALSDDSHVTAGVTKVPFGLLPFASNNYFFSLAYYVGLEDDYDLGVVYEQESGPWHWQLGYFFADEGSFHGRSRDSARYSYDVVSEGEVRNDERDQLNLWLERTLAIGGLDEAALGVSFQYGRIPNRTTGRAGDMAAVALHATASLGHWAFKLETAYYRYGLENPPGQPDNLVYMGAYDFAYQVAAEGRLHALDIAYAWDISGKVLDRLTLYNDYSILFKPADGFATSQQNVTGAALDFDGPLLVYVDFALGKHNAWIGPDFGTALGPGGEGGWEHRFNINVGLYF